MFIVIQRHRLHFYLNSTTSKTRHHWWDSSPKTKTSVCGSKPIWILGNTFLKHRYADYTMTTTTLLYWSHIIGGNIRNVMVIFPIKKIAIRYCQRFKNFQYIDILTNEELLEDKKANIYPNINEHLSKKMSNVELSYINITCKTEQRKMSSFFPFRLSFSEKKKVR